MPSAYTSLPNPRADPEMEASFGDSDSEDDEESQPLVRPSETTSSRPTAINTAAASTYDFEDVDRYDYPPPGSPPSTAMPNNFGNSNGLIPAFSETVARPSVSWLGRAAQRIGLSRRPAENLVIGERNDGVFANVTAKPTTARRIANPEDPNAPYISPEDAQNEAPPSYTSAQADAVPPYWETTIHAPFSGDSMISGEMLIDSMPTGNYFSFLCTMLISVAFQFVGFLFTYLLHGTHATRLGSRAGLGVTLIQYGFALRTQLETADDNADMSVWSGAPYITGDMTANATMFAGNETTTPTMLTEEQASMILADATTEWLSFFLMTVGWFILFTSVLAFWRVKRWEQGILASQQPQASPSEPIRASILRHFSSLYRPRSADDEHLRRMEEGHNDEEAALVVDDEEARETERLLAELPEGDPRREQLQRQLEHERQLQRDLRDAGFL